MSLLTPSQLVRYRLPLLCLACLQAFLGSGIFYGWPSLYALLLDTGVYSREECGNGWSGYEDDAVTVCDRQKKRLTFIYTIASSANLCSQLPWGFILDFLGPRVCNLWSTTIVIIGFVLLSLSERGVFDAYMLAICLIGGGGPGAQISLFHLSELFPTKQKSTVLSVVTGAFQLGFVVFMLFHLAYTHLHVTLANMALIYCVPLLALLLLGGVLWPDTPCIPPDDLDPLSFTSRRPSQSSLPSKSRRSLVVYTPEYPGGFLAQHEEMEAQAQMIGHAPKWQQTAPEQQLHQDQHHESTEAVNVLEEGFSPVPVSTSRTAEESQPIFRNVNVEGKMEDELEGTHSVAAGEYGSLAHQHQLPSPSPSLHHVHCSLHELRLSQSNPNLKGVAASKGFLSQVRAASYLLCLVWMSLCLFWANFYIGTVFEQLYVKSEGDLDQARHYTDIFTLLLPSGILGIGAFGWLTSELGFSTTIACTSVFGVGYSASSMWFHLSLQPLTFILYSFFRSFLFSVMFAYLANEFGYRHFGLLSGILLAMGGAIGCLQYPLVQSLVVHQNNNDTYDDNHDSDESSSSTPRSSFHLVNQLQFFTFLTTFYFAAYVLWRQRARAKRIEEQIERKKNQLQKSPIIPVQTAPEAEIEA